MHTIRIRDGPQRTGVRPVSIPSSRSEADRPIMPRNKHVQLINFFRSIKISDLKLEFNTLYTQPKTEIFLEFQKNFAADDF